MDEGRGGCACRPCKVYPPATAECRLREGDMTRRVCARLGGAAIGIIVGGTLLFSQTQPPIEGPAAGGSPAWFLQGSFPDPGGRTIVEPGGKVTIPGREGGA